ncbi:MULTISPECIES: VOC family protein [unclassified Streptomyces]|uniref:VOC family protein n=1 Tax=unclassified Streptomyces TaxID=2593676 RepID=UPI0035DF1AAF
MRLGRTVRDTPWPHGSPCWVEVRLGDPTRAGAFYGELFGWTFFDHGPDYDHYLTARLDGRAVADIGPRPSEEAAGEAPAWLVCLAVDDAEAAADAVLKAGGGLLLPPCDVGTHGRFAVAADPAGAEFAVWQAGEYLGAEIAGVAGSVVRYHCLSTDVEASQGFYADVFGHTVRGAGDGGVVLELDGRPVAGLGEPPAGVPSHWTVAFGVADTDAAVARVVALGGSLRASPCDTLDGRCARVADEQGTPFELLAVGGAG